MPTARGALGVAVVNGKIYAIGGLNGNDEPISTVEEYNPTTNTWANKRSMPTPRSGFATAVYQNKIYVIGGSIGNGYVGNNEVYDPQLNTWTTETSMPTPRADFGANVVNDAIYLIGGKRYSSSAPFYTETGINEVYYPSNDSWSTKTALPTPVQGYGSAVIANKIYVIGGSSQPTSLGPTSIVNNNQVYDAQTDQWTLAAPFPNVVSYGAAAATVGYLAPQGLYYIGGFSGEYSSQTKILNLSNNSWSKVDSMPTPRGYLAVAVVSDVLYAIGGFDGSNWLSINEQYKPVGYGTVAPKVNIISPENKTYKDVPLDFTVNRVVDWMGYDLDDQANVTLTSPINLLNLTQGGHYIAIYANDSSGNMGISNTVYFSVDTVAPTIQIKLPKNQSYDSTDIQLAFTVNEEATSLAYSIDGQAKVPIIGNVTLVALSNGAHHVAVYSTDAMGNLAEETVYFNIAPFPILAVVAILTIIIIVVSSGYLFFKRRKTEKDKQ